MTNAIPFDDWINEQGDNVRLAMCDGHPETLILVDMTDMGVYKYVPAENQDGACETMKEFVQHEMRDIHDKQLGFKVTKASELNIVCEFMKGYRDGTTIASGVAKSLLAQANSEKATLMRRIDKLCKENEQLREYAASAWQLFVENGAVDVSKLPEVDAVRNGLSELGIKVDKF